MKKFTLTWLCLTYITTFALADDYHLFQTPMSDAEIIERSGLAGKFAPIVWVLIQPDGQRPLVFQKFDSPQMEAWLRLQACGSVVHIHANPLAVDPNMPALEVFNAFETFKASCQKQGIKCVNETPPD
ncbi:MAG TPA: hypothetical protein VIK62_04045 [Verrucomicrobiae bacterium]